MPSIFILQKHLTFSSLILSPLLKNLSHYPSVGTEEEDAPPQETLSFFKKLVSEIQGLHLTEMYKLPIQLKSQLVAVT